MVIGFKRNWLPLLLKYFMKFVVKMISVIAFFLI